MDAYGHYCRPGLARVLGALGLDVSYDRAEGNRLWYQQNGNRIEVLDLVGGYGANLFGHNHPELVEALRLAAASRVPNLVQGSLRGGAARLARALSDRVGDVVVTFTNSGAETVEAALKHAYLQRRKSLFWAVRGAFHGKTLGAIQLTWSYREPFVDMGPAVRFLDPRDPADWVKAEEDAEEVAAAFIEPMLGEGGIHPLPEPFIEWLAQTCARNGIPLVADEIQTGMGRSGTFLLLEQLGIEADYICLSKALGGGLVKIGALLIRRDQFCEEFSVLHTSTFAEDEISSRVALTALDIMDRDRLPERCSQMGRYLMERLESVRRRFPEQLKAVRGRGLMVGLELHDLAESRSNCLRLISQEGYLGALAAGCLLHRHHVRVAPALTQPSTLRVEPSAYITRREIDRFVDACSALCSAFQRLDLMHLTGYLADLNAPTSVDHRRIRSPRRERASTSRRVAFVGHFIKSAHLPLWDPAFGSFPRDRLGRLVARTARVVGPATYDEVCVRSATGEIVHLSFIGLYLTSRQIEQAMRDRDYHWILEKIERAVRLAKDRGCQVVGLGGYTSILTGNCTRVKTNGIALTSGNALTVGAGVKALRRVAREEGIQLRQSALGIVGAGGNIARAYAEILSGDVAELRLIVRRRTLPRHRSLIHELQENNPDLTVRLYDRIEAVRECNLIVSATNSAAPLIYPEHLHEPPVVICDLSVPGDVAPEVMEVRGRATVLPGGIVRLPLNEDFFIDGIPLERGYSFACMAETLLMGLEGRTTHGSYGRITRAHVLDALALGEKHGFDVGCVQPEKSY